jgi:hypothetical protein
MMVMREELLHFIWRYGLYDRSHLCTTDGEALSIVYVGDYNTDAGPDFIASKIRIDDTLLAGSIELHVDQLDWQRHKHQHDPAYNNVILHVVYQGDGTAIPLHSGQTAPTLVLERRIDLSLLSRYETLMSHSGHIPCESLLPQYEGGLALTAYLTKLAVERLESKVMSIEQALHRCEHDWEQVTSINKEPFATLARSMPLRILRKHIDKPLQVEALLYGQAGMLEQEYTDEYPASLRREYMYLKRLYSLSPMPIQSWKFFRIRPANFPSIKIGQLAALVCNTYHLLDSLTAAHTLQNLQEMFDLRPHPYWQQHYRFDDVAASIHTADMGDMHTDILVINAIVPLLFAYGRYKADEEICERAYQLLTQIPAEHNSIIKQWQQYGIRPAHAADSQALIQLTRQYCEQKHCLSCTIGHGILRNK